MLSKRSSELRLADLRDQRGRDAARDLVLQREQITGHAVEVAGPHDGAVGRLRELDGHAHPRAGATDAAGEDIRGADGPPHDADVDAATIAKRRAARDHQELADRGERSDDVLDDAFAEVVLAEI